MAPLTLAIADSDDEGVLVRKQISLVPTPSCAAPLGSALALALHFPSDFGAPQVADASSCAVELPVISDSEMKLFAASQRGPIEAPVTPEVAASGKRVMIGARAGITSRPKWMRTPCCPEG